MFKKVVSIINPFNNTDTDDKLLYIIKVILQYLFIYIVGMLVAEGIVIGLHYALGYDVLNGEMMDENTMLLFKYYGYIISIFTAMIFIKKVNKSSIDELGFNKKVIDYVKGFLPAIISLVIIIGILMLLGQVHFEGFNKNIDFKLLFLFLGGFIIQGAMEETLCRGFLMTQLNKKIGKHLSILISFIAFTFPHLSSFLEDGLLIGIVAIINLLLVTYVFSYLMLKYKNIYACSGFHSIWNFVLFGIIGLNLSGTTNNFSLLSFSADKNFLMGGSYGIEASIITTVILSILVIRLSKNSKVKQ
ncbi:MAG: CPBP family intramembrane metalloprotease [Clostridia bacterium]|nr:CPBP family intramembrane metalloprotease [Clostridia bacterium]